MSFVRFRFLKGKEAAPKRLMTSEQMLIAYVRNIFFLLLLWFLIYIMILGVD